MIFEIEIIVAPYISLRRRWMRPEGRMDDARHQKSGNERSIRITENDVVIHDFLTGEDHFFCRECRFAHYAEVAPDVSVSCGVGALHVEDSDIRMDSPDREQFLPGEGAADRQKLRALAEIASTDCARRQEGQSYGGGLQSETDRKIRVLFYFDRIRNAGLGSSAVIMSEAGGDISDP